MNIRKLLSVILIILALSACSLGKGVEEYTGLYTYSEGQTAFSGLYQTASDLLDQGDYAEAESIYRDLIKKEPDLANGYVGLATSLNMQERQLEAIDIYQEALEISPDSPAAYVGLGSSYYALELYDDAIQNYSSALSLNPRDPNGHWGMALALEKSGRYQEAVEHLEIIMDLVPNTSLAEYAENLLNEIHARIE